MRFMPQEGTSNERQANGWASGKLRSRQACGLGMTRGRRVGDAGSKQDTKVKWVRARVLKVGRRASAN